MIILHNISSSHFSHMRQIIAALWIIYELRNFLSQCSKDTIVIFFTHTKRKRSLFMQDRHVSRQQATERKVPSLILECTIYFWSILQLPLQSMDCCMYIHSIVATLLKHCTLNRDPVAHISAVEGIVGQSSQKRMLAHKLPNATLCCRTCWYSSMPPYGRD